MGKMSVSGRKVSPSPHDDDAGIIATYSNPLMGTGRFVCLYDGAAQGLDTDGGKYTIVCQHHSNTLSHNNRARAQWLARNVTQWCEDCMEEEEQLKLLVIKIKESQ